MRDTIDVTTLGDLLVRTTNRFPNKDFLVFPERRVTYSEMLDVAYRRAKALVALGIRQGDHVGILMANCVEYIECLMAAQMIGAVAVLINARYKAPELAYILDNADIDLLITHDAISEYANFAELITSAIEIKQPKRLAQKVMIAALADGFISDEAFHASGNRISQEEIDELRLAVVLRDPAIMMYTSGTTAHPKGCPLNHEVLVRNAINADRSRYFLTPTDRFWAPLPMFHMASILPLMCCMGAGSAMLTQSHFEAGQALEFMEREKVSIAFPAFPTVTMDLIQHPKFKETDLSNLRRINNVAPPDLLRKFQDAFPQAVQTSAYGLTEAGGVIAFNHPGESLDSRLHTCGQPLPGLNVKIVDPDTLEEKPAGEKGEILLRGYSVFDGYYKSPDKNAECFVDGWFRTGDLCALTEEGHIEFHGRIKDMLKIGGENVAAIEIESLLSTHPAVGLVQVIGVPDDRLVEVACAYIELKAGAEADAQEFIDFCKGKIASFKVPRHVRIVTEWPMSTTKIQKYVLREWFVAEAH